MSVWDTLLPTVVSRWTGRCRRERQKSPLVFVMVADEILGGLRPRWERDNFVWTCDEVSPQLFGIR